MCGFSAVLALDGSRPDDDVVTRMCGLIAHRGPDDVGFFKEAHAAFAFRRLAILDLAASSHQPMLSHDGRHVIVFNGEIYNFLELRDELKTLGHEFRSDGDTEVLLAAYRQWGEDCLQRLNGMWAFLIYDQHAKSLFGARDRFGVKPLFVYRDARAIVLSSELKAIRDSGIASLSINWRTAAFHLLQDELDARTETFYERVEQIPAGTAFAIDAKGRMTSRRYWSLDRVMQTHAKEADPVARFRELFADSVRLRLRSDVPVGVQLSGGLDSTSIITTMSHQLGVLGGAELFAFCYMAPQFDETPQIEATLTQTGATLVRLKTTARELWDDLQKHLWYQDEPVHSFTSVVGYQLMKLARAHGVKVLLNGQGADEVLAGYANYFNDYWLELLLSGQVRTCWREMNDFAHVHGERVSALRGANMLRALRTLASRLPGHEALARRKRQERVLANPWVSRRVKASWLEAQDHRRHLSVNLRGALRDSVERTPLPLYLRVEDRNSMAHGVEVRLPFLDYRLVAMAFQLDAGWKLNGGHTKVLLRRSMQGHIPDVVRTQVRKLGFPTPVEEWFRNELYEPLQDLLASPRVREADIWNVDFVREAARRHRDGELSCGGRLFDVVQTSMWLQGVKEIPSAVGTKQSRGVAVT